MKIRNKIALWITAAGFCASLIFSAVIYLELVEQPFEMADADLATHITDLKLIGQKSANLKNFLDQVEKLPSYNRTWLAIFDNKGSCLWRSSLAERIPVALPSTMVPFTVETDLPPSQILPGVDEDDPLVFRLQANHIIIGKKKATILAGRAMLDIGAETKELATTLTIGLAIAALVMFALSFFLARRILQPIDEITRLAQKITDQTLDRRIPVSNTKDELHRLSITLNTMFDRLENSFARQKQLLADASHELKSPIAICRLQVEEALQQIESQPAIENLLIRQAEILHRTERLVTNLLDLSALELKRSIKPDQVCLAKIVRQVLDDYADLFENWKLELAINLPQSMPMQGDHDQLQRLIVNLVDNAAKYNQTNGKVIINGKVTAERLQLEIANTGQSIPKDDLEYIFDQFYRVEKSRTQNHGGAGLGLAIARRIVELHKGCIRVSSTESGWTRFEIVFPSSPFVSCAGRMPCIRA